MPPLIEPRPLAACRAHALWLARVWRRDDYFFQALDWVLMQDAAVVETTKAGVVLTALSHFHGVATKAEWVCAAVRGFVRRIGERLRLELDARIRLQQPLLLLAAVGDVAEDGAHRMGVDVLA